MRQVYIKGQTTQHVHSITSRAYDDWARTSERDCTYENLTVQGLGLIDYSFTSDPANDLITQQPTLTLTSFDLFPPSVCLFHHLPALTLLLQP